MPIPSPPSVLTWVPCQYYFSTGEVHGGHELGSKVALSFWYIWPYWTPLGRTKSATYLKLMIKFLRSGKHWIWGVLVLDRTQLKCSQLWKILWRGQACRMVLHGCADAYVISWCILIGYLADRDRRASESQRHTVRRFLQISKTAWYLSQLVFDHKTVTSFIFIPISLRDVWPSIWASMPNVSHDCTSFVWY